MMPKVLIDTDVILDVFLEREPHFSNSKEVLFLLDDGGFHGFTTAIIIVNVFYHVKKYRGTALAFACVESLLSNPDLNILNVDKSLLIASLKSGMTDFEDAVQAAAADSEKIDYIVTRNLKDYKNSKVPVLSPMQLLDRLENRTGG